ncbi:MAG: hypothetical protein DRJ03_23395 [Chloroflexi bacterium]|nr:MAG: hypothetical protein DRJ03_23395 [Chloroflexota bacterium]
MTEILAVDIGYGFTKAVMPKTKTIIYSIVGPAEQIRFESDVVASNGHGITVKVDGRFFFVGEQAALQSASASQTLDVTRTGSTEQKALFYAVASELVRTTSKQVVVVSGLPVANFDERNKRALRKMFEGDHQVLWQGKRARRFQVTHVYTIPQGVGALFALVLDRRGRLADGDLAGGRVAIIDIGMLTTNFILADRLRYVETGSDSITSGMSEPLTKIAKQLNREYGLNWGQQLGRVDQAVRARSVKVYGEQVDIAGLIGPHIDSLASTILAKARMLWSDGSDLEAVVLTGGGSREIASYLRRVYPHTRMASGDPQFANVMGYLRAGLRRFG